MIMPGKFTRTSVLPLILLLAALLRFYHLGEQSLWSDEGNSVALAQHSFIEIAQRTAYDIHPPFYYWLLKLWMGIFGDSETGLRSLSAILGISLIYLINLLGRCLFNHRVGLIAALLAALAPLQVYYAQEARMYMLLTLLSALTMLLALSVFAGWPSAQPSPNERGSLAFPPWGGIEGGRCSFILPNLAYILTVTAGLYTHYSYPLMLVIVNIVAPYFFWQRSRPNLQSPNANPQVPISRWLLLQLIPLLLYLPWLSIAWRQITTWPSEQSPLSGLQILERISITLLFGLSWPFGFGLTAVISLGVILLATLRISFQPRFSKPYSYPSIRPRFSVYSGGCSLLRLGSFLLIWLWFLLPVILTILVFSPAFLKFLLVATPPLALLIAVAIDGLVTSFNKIFTVPRWPGYVLGGSLLAGLATTSILSLSHYYTNPTFARDNYRGIVQFIKAVGGPEDVVILNAEGQQDVFNYYHRAFNLNMAVYPLPRQRPLNETATLNELQTIAAHAEKIYAVYWATEQADPQGIIEGWLDRQLFKATDQWYGNVRLVSYAGTKGESRPAMTAVDYQLGPHIHLTGYGLREARPTPGDILQIALTWQTDGPLTENYTVFVQILDPANHLVGQRDALPPTPTVDWPSGEPISDTHGLFIEPGTPPGPHRLIIGLYNTQTGQRLPLDAIEGPQDFIELTTLEIVPPASPLPLAAFNIPKRLDEKMGEITLLGYDLYKLGHRSDSDGPLHPGDPLQVVAYWRVESPISRLADALKIEIRSLKSQTASISITRPPAGVYYPVSAWRVGEIIRAQYSFPLTGLTPAGYRPAFIMKGKAGGQEFVAVGDPFWIE